MKKIHIQFFVIICGLVLLYFNQRRINRYQEDYKMNRIVDDPEIPASLSVTSFAMGPLRSIIANTLWWRAVQQQDRGEYFDAIQLADWITKLQPTYASVWAYLGWNMSYNIAHDFAEPEDRWQWIVRAIRLLRDEGLKYNPDNLVIRHELARIFYDRIGGKIDPAAEFFKNQWAFLMMEYFDSGDRIEIEKLQRAAESIEALRDRPGIMEYSQAAREIGVDVFDFRGYPPRKGWLDVKIPHHLKVQAGWEIYYCYKRYKIEEELKLDIDRLLYIDTEFGPLDWRLHQAHTLYWAAEKDFDDFMKSGINFARVVRQSMLESFYEGRLFHNPKKNIITRISNLKIIGRIHDYFDYYMEHEPSHNVDRLHKNFLEQAVTILYSHNHIKAARELFGHYEEDYLKGNKLSFEQFVTRSMEKSLGDGQLSSGQALVEAALFKSFEWIDIGDYDRSNGYFNLAKLLWTRHQTQFQNRSQAKLLPPFEELVSASKGRFTSKQGVDRDLGKQTLDIARQKSIDDVYIGDTEKTHKKTPSQKKTNL